MIYHITARALAFLAGEDVHAKPLGQPACGEPPPEGATRFDFCCTEDVRAFLTKQHAIFLSKKDLGGYEVIKTRVPQAPTCIKCQMLYAAALLTETLDRDKIRPSMGTKRRVK